MRRGCVGLPCWSTIVLALAGTALVPRAEGAEPAVQQTGKALEGTMVRANLEDWRSTPGLEGLEGPFEYLTRTDLAALPLGRTAIDGDDVYVIVSEAETRAPEAARFEAHRRYLDIQLVLRGQETLGVAPAASLSTSEPYDATKDIEFFARPQDYVTLALHAGEFAVFGPADGHMPSLHLSGPHVSRKAVVKVSLAYRDRQRAAR
jgi:biofilm protein TabA